MNVLVLRVRMHCLFALPSHLSWVVNHEKMCCNFAGKKLELFYSDEKGCNYKFNMSTLCAVYAHRKCLFLVLSNQYVRPVIYST